jgi:predicted nucleic acid-binding protein
LTSYVLDASVAAKWFIPGDEPFAAEASVVLADYVAGQRSLIVPDLFWPESGNILWKAVRLGRISRPSASRALLNLQQIRIPTVPSEPYLNAAFEIAAAFERSVYDALYVAVAVSCNWSLLTADERLVNALGSKFPIRWLGAFSAD